MQQHLEMIDGDILCIIYATYICITIVRFSPFRFSRTINLWPGCMFGTCAREEENEEKPEGAMGYKCIIYRCRPVI